MENNFAKNLKKLRIQNDLTQEELGNILKKDYSTIGKWELGQRSPIMEDVIKIAEYFNISLQELIGGDYTNKFNYNSSNDEEYKQILKNKGLMDENENINEENLDKLIKIANMIEGLTQKKED